MFPITQTYLGAHPLSASVSWQNYFDKKGTPCSKCISKRGPCSKSTSDCDPTWSLALCPCLLCQSLDGMQAPEVLQGVWGEHGGAEMKWGT